MAIDLTAFLTENLREVVQQWGKDLAAHRDDRFFVTPEGGRSAADFTYETLFVNRRMISRAKSEVPQAMDGFPTCPEELRSRDALAAALAASVEEFLAVAGDPEREIVRQDGTRLSVFELGHFMMTHMMYHLGQLNYVQTVYGDPDIHWF